MHVRVPTNRIFVSVTRLAVVGNTCDTVTNPTEILSDTE